METETKNTNAVSLLGENLVTISGKITSEGTFNHEVFGERFFMYDLTVKRLSETPDVIPVMISERLINLEELKVGTDILIKGQFRSYNKHEEGKAHLMLSVFARELTLLEEESNENSIILTGFICKAPIYRKTPLKREITDLLLAVNRPYGKSDYIPCITWGRNAKYASEFKVGQKVTITGRVQSRQYNKKVSEDKTESKTTYEVSANKIVEAE